MNSPITPGSNNAAISAMATTTTQLKHDGIYYYNADLKKATEAVEDNPDHSQNSKDIDTYYYGGIQGAPPPANASNTPSKRPINETYYDDGDVGGVVEPGINDAEKGKTSSATSSYQNVSSPAKTTNTPVQKVNRPALPALPRFGSDLNKPTERIYRNETVETPFGSKPTYGNTGRKLPGLDVNDKYESLDSNTRDTSSEYAELK
ncbi:uncharacterized protein LOC117336109 [Pecten maximus]|uniref:uncharacterized protein LOC117336109 n=1 Tax=Pecten maximus TaxID=6579 RepID=UPI00145905B9|nr:uncharacterized protein LOC117336109 [Pecten maximus]